MFIDKFRKFGTHAASKMQMFVKEVHYNTGRSIFPNFIFPSAMKYLAPNISYHYSVSVSTLVDC